MGHISDSGFLTQTSSRHCPWAPTSPCSLGQQVRCGGHCFPHVPLWALCPTFSFCILSDFSLLYGLLCIMAHLGHWFRGRSACQVGHPQGTLNLCVAGLGGCRNYFCPKFCRNRWWPYRTQPLCFAGGFGGSKGSCSSQDGCENTEDTAWGWRSLCLQTRQPRSRHVPMPQAFSFPQHKPLSIKRAWDKGGWNGRLTGFSPFEINRYLF